MIALNVRLVTCALVVQISQLALLASTVLSTLLLVRLAQRDTTVLQLLHIQDSAMQDSVQHLAPNFAQLLLQRAHQRITWQAQLLQHAQQDSTTFLTLYTQHQDAKIALSVTIVLRYIRNQFRALQANPVLRKIWWLPSPALLEKCATTHILHK